MLLALLLVVSLLGLAFVLLALLITQPVATLAALALAVGANWLVGADANRRRQKDGRGPDRASA